MLLTLDSVLKSPNKQSSLTDDEDSDDDDIDEKSRKNINLQNDDLYLQFSSCSHDIGEYLQSAVNNPSQSLKKLKNTLNKIDGYIRFEVVSQHESLLSQSDDVAKLESDLKLIRDRVHMIENHINRIRNGVINPFHDFKKKSKQSLNLQIGESLLRSILRMKKLLSQLNEYFHKNKDMVKSAACIAEIMIQIKQINDISIIDNKRDYILSVYQQINDLGKQKLSSGLRSLNQPNIAIGLQVFYNLGVDKLNNIIKIILQTSMEQCRENIKKALMIQAQVDSEEKKSDISVKSSLLIRLDKCINHHLFGNLLQIWNLEKVLRKKNDSSAAATPYIELVSDEFNNTLIFWANLIEIIKQEFEFAARESLYINNILINEYVRLYQMLTDFYHKVESTTCHYDQTLPVNQQDKLVKITGLQHRQHLIASVDTFEELFFNKCIERIKQPLNILFSNKEQRRIPTIADMRTLWTTFYNELKITQDCAQIQCNIAQIIYLNGIYDMVVHLKKKIVDITTCNTSDEEITNDFRHNIDIFNCIQALYFHISSFLKEEKIKLSSQQCNIYLREACNLLYNFNCYVLYYCLRVLWYNIISGLCLSINNMKQFSIDIQFISNTLLPLVHGGVAMDYVLKQWICCLTMLYLQILTLNFDISNKENVQIIATNMAQFIKFLRIFEDKYNVDIVICILMLQQFKRMLIQFNDIDNKDEDNIKDINILQKEHPNLSLYIISQFILSWINRSQNKNNKSFNTLIGMTMDEYVTNAFIKKNFFSLFDFNINNNTKIATQIISVDIMSMSDQQYNFLQIIASKLKDSKHKYMPQIEKLFKTT